MDQGSSAIDLAALLARLVQLEAKVAEQDRVIAEQQQIIAEQRATIITLREALDTAHEQITLLKKRLFSAKRERLLTSPDQKYLFETMLLEPTAVDTATLSTNTKAPKKPKKPRRKFVFPDFLPVIRHEHKLNDEECKCGNCGTPRVALGVGPSSAHSSSPSASVPRRSRTSPPPPSPTPHSNDRVMWKN